HDQKIDILRANLGSFQATSRGDSRQVAGADTGACHPPLEDAGPLYDPIGVKAVGVAQVSVGDYRVWHATAEGHDLYARQLPDMNATARGWLGRVAHRREASLVRNQRSKSSGPGVGHETQCPRTSALRPFDL